MCCDHERECDDNVGNLLDKFTHKLDVEFMDERIDALQIDFFFFTLICILVLALVEQTAVSLYDMECLLDSND